MAMNDDVCGCKWEKWEVVEAFGLIFWMEEEKEATDGRVGKGEDDWMMRMRCGR